MANEISITAKLNVSKGGASATNLTSTDTLDMTGVNISSDVQDVGTSYETISTGGVDTTGSDYWVLIYNMDATNFITVSFNASTAHALIPPGGLFGPIKKVLNTVVSVKFDTAAGQANVIACEA